MAFKKNSEVMSGRNYRAAFFGRIVFFYWHNERSPIELTAPAAPRHAIHLELADDCQHLGAEGYRLSITPDAMKIFAAKCVIARSDSDEAISLK